MEAIMDFLESLRNSLQFTYKLCLLHVIDEREKRIWRFGSDADFGEDMYTGFLDQPHYTSDNFLLVTRI